MARTGLMGKRKIISILQGNIENVLREWSADRDRIAKVDFDLRESVAGTLYLKWER